jgi:hypothetical protein
MRNGAAQNSKTRRRERRVEISIQCSQVEQLPLVTRPSPTKTADAGQSQPRRHAVALPGHAADAALYTTNRSYRRIGSRLAGDTGPTIVAQQVPCNEGCTAASFACIAICAVSGGPFAPLCAAGCTLSLGLCLNDCPSDGGGGGGGPQPCCPRGRTCCGTCTDQGCDDACIGPGQQCP